MIRRPVRLVLLAAAGLAAWPGHAAGAGAGVPAVAPRTTLERVRLVEKIDHGRRGARLGFTACGTPGALQVRVLETISTPGPRGPVTSRIRRAKTLPRGQRRACQRTVVIWRVTEKFLAHGRYAVRLSVKAGDRRFSLPVWRRRDRAA
jgi:hypothetical protein